MRNTRTRMRGTGLVATMLLALLQLAPSGALAQGWEMRVCADPASLPFSHRDGSGFENRIAAILAEELGAELTYVWWPQGSTMIDEQLREGRCDLIMGIPDGYDGLLNTLAYYRSPYVFVSRADGPPEIRSLDDPALAELDIGVQSGGIPPHDALVERGLGDAVTFDPGRHVPLESVVEAVANGVVDLGIAWGPVAGYFAPRQSAELDVVPIEPTFTASQQLTVLSMTMGLRPGDEAFRDRLNAALAARWDEIRDVLRGYGVPLATLPRPSAARAPSEEATRIGLVVPTATGTPLVDASLYDVVGEAARRGALLAESDLDAAPDRTGPRLDVLLASAPSAEAAARAGERLVATEGVAALIGGLGDGQAAVLAALAQERRVPFLNIGDVGEALRRRCDPLVFHVEASAGTYLDASVEWFAGRGHRRWFVVREEGAEGGDRARRAREAVASHPSGGRVVGDATVVAEQPTYFAELAEAREAGADAIFLLLDARDQIAFLSQLEQEGLDVAVAPYPDPVAQTRNYLASVQDRVAGTEARQRVALWDPTLEAAGAGDLNERFASRWGEPMDPSAWAAYASVRLLHGAVAEAGASDPAAIAKSLERPTTDPAIAKRGGVSFRPRDHQLRQSLYVVETDPDAAWGASVASRIGVAEVVAEIPAAGSDGKEPRDRSGDPRDGAAASCAP